MKQNSRAFTLIELLAVIVILGIIAVIAVPIVKNITKDAKMKSFMNSARGIIRAGDLYYSRKDMMDEVSGDMTFEFPNNASELELNGKLPETGKMIITEDGDIALAISNGKYCVTKGFNDKDITITENAETCEIPVKEIVLGMPVYFNPVSNQICENYVEANSEMGVKTGCMRWYVYKMDDDNVGLILDHNTTAEVPWISASDYAESNADDNTVCSHNTCNDEGPITLMNQLKSDTEDQGWKVKASVITIDDIMNMLPWYQNLEDKSNWTEDYSIYLEEAFDEVWSKVEENTSDYANELEKDKAMTNMLATDYSEIALPSYLRVGLYDYCDTDVNCTTYGYWTLSAYAGDSENAWVVDWYPLVNYYYAGTSINGGVRPVISLSKSAIQ